MVMGLNTGLWVSAQVRICDRAFIPATVVRHGDPDAGASEHGVRPRGDLAIPYQAIDLFARADK